MDCRRTRLILVIAVALSLAACSRAPATTAAPAAVAPPAPPPAKPAHMVCRSSVDGRKVACGTPNAVMVGIKTD